MPIIGNKIMLFQLVLEYSIQHVTIAGNKQLLPTLKIKLFLQAHTIILRYIFYKYSYDCFSLFVHDFQNQNKIFITDVTNPTEMYFRALNALQMGPLNGPFFPKQNKFL
jgi:hypothetical protein